MTPRVAVLFDGAGLARLGLEQAGFDCIGFEIDPIKHHMSSYVGSGNVELLDVTTRSWNDYDCIWASPPCQNLSQANIKVGNVQVKSDLLTWSLRLPSKWLWVENVLTEKHSSIWGTVYNAAQFLPTPLQNRNRIIGGRYISPYIYRPYKRNYPEAMPTILATEYKVTKLPSNNNRIRCRAGSAFGRRLDLEEVAYYQGLEIPTEWNQFSVTEQYEAIGNGVPPYMSKAFGDALINHLERNNERTD